MNIKLTRKEKANKMMRMKKEEQLWEKITKFFEGKKVIVAFSGGLDSTVLLEAALATATKVQAVFIKTDLIQNEDENIVTEYAKKRQVDLKIFRIDLLKNEKVVENGPLRCYYCKKTLFSTVKEQTNNLDFDMIVEGTNYTDLSDYRPGLKALKELGLTSPFIELGINKQEIKTLASYFSFPILKKEATTCLATRIAYGMEITKERLEKIEKAELFVKSLLNVKTLRVRDHGDLARIEVEQSLIDKLAAKEIREKIVEEFIKLGFKYVSLDLEGYLQGSMNKVIQKE